MEKEKALNLLKEYLWELDNLRTLHHNNKERWLWKDKVNVVLEAAFGKDSDEYEKLNPKIYIGAIGGLSDAEEQAGYLLNLEKYETGIVKILQKYEILGLPKESANESGKSIIEQKPKAFIVHGGKSGVLEKLREFVEALGIKPLIVEMLPSKGMTLSDKVSQE